MASDLMAAETGSGVLERAAGGPSLGQPRQNEKVHRHTVSEQVMADNPHGEEQSRLLGMSYHYHHHQVL